MEIFRAWNTCLKCHSAWKVRTSSWLKFQFKVCNLPGACGLSLSHSLGDGRPSSCPHDDSTCDSGELAIYCQGISLYIVLFSVTCTCSFTCGRYGSPATWDMPFIVASKPLSRPCDWWRYWWWWGIICPTLTLLFRWCHLLWLQDIQPHGRVCVNVLLLVMVSIESPAPQQGGELLIYRSYHMTSMI